jgi:hypothetical protein
MFLLKCSLAPTLLIDDLSHPTTMTPIGCLSMAMVSIGGKLQRPALVTSAAVMHALVMSLFLFRAFTNNAKPEPSWYPNTVSIAVSANALFPYNPFFSRVLLLFSGLLFVFVFPISLWRVQMNGAIAPTVCWLQMSAPAGLLIAFVRAAPDSMSCRNEIARFLFGCCMVSVVSVARAIVVRWDALRRHPFSPAHAAFCFPSVAHANAVASFHKFLYDTRMPVIVPPPPQILYFYLVTVVAVASAITIVVVAMFFLKLKGWVDIDITGIEEVADTLSVRALIGAEENDELEELAVDTALLRAYENGTLVVARQGDEDGNARNLLVRTKLSSPSYGFVPAIGLGFGGGDIRSDYDEVSATPLSLGYVGGDETPPFAHFRSPAVSVLDSIVSGGSSFSVKKVWRGDGTVFDDWKLVGSLGMMGGVRRQDLREQERGENKKEEGEK